MSADLLRRAAATLRARADGVPEYFAPPWHPVLTDSESLTGVRSCPQHDPAGDDLAEEDKTSWACRTCEHVETCSVGLAGYFATLHPPVAVALADLFNAMASFAEVSRNPLPDGSGTLVAVARAVLREER